MFQLVSPSTIAYFMKSNHCLLALQPIWFLQRPSKVHFLLLTTYYRLGWWILALLNTWQALCPVFLFQTPTFHIPLLLWQMDRCDEFSPTCYPSLTLWLIYFVPEFPFNVVSLAKIKDSLNCLVTFALLYRMSRAWLVGSLWKAISTSSRGTTNLVTCLHIFCVSLLFPSIVALSFWPPSFA